MDKYKLLGSAVLVYALLTSGALLSFALGLPEAMNGALWLAYVIGGIGLIRGKSWGQTLTFIAAGGSLTVMVLGNVELFFISTVWSLQGLPALAILVSVLLVKLPPSKEVEVATPTGAFRTLRENQRARHDTAYISFMVLGLISLWTSYFVYSEIQAAKGGTSGVDGVLGFLVFIPFGIPLLLALIFGPGLSVFLRHDYRLMTLTVFTVALVIALGYLGYTAWPMLLSLYAAVCITIGLIWFIKYRKRFGY